MNFLKLAIAAVTVFTMIFIVIIYAISTNSASDQGTILSGLQASPAAFNNDGGVSEISYSLNNAHDLFVLFAVTDASGSVYRTIDIGLQSDGHHVIPWNGQDGDGNLVPDGNYTVKVNVGTRPWRGASDLPNNSVASAITYVIVDESAPEIRITAPSDGMTYKRDQAVMASWSVSDETSGLKTMSGTTGSGKYLDTATVGTHEFTITAADNAGNTADKTLLYFVDDPAVKVAYQRAEVRIKASSQAVYDAEIADSPEKIYKGLMYRTALAPGAGMLFVFSGDQDHYFWMENTRIPLDLIYISSDFAVVGIYENAVPNSVDLIVPPAPCKFVLEVNAGQCREHGIRAGDDVEICT